MSKSPAERAKHVSLSTRWRMMEIAVRLRYNRALHHIEEIWDFKCRCNPMPHYRIAAAVAVDLGLTLEKADWTGESNYAYQEDAMQRYNALLAARSNGAALKKLRERALTSAESRGAWEALRLGEAADTLDYLEAMKKRQTHKAKYNAPKVDENVATTWIRFVKITHRVECSKLSAKTCIFISDSADLETHDGVETWKMVNELTIGVIYKETETEVIVAAEETVLSTMTYDKASLVLLRCVGQVGIALELLAAVADLTDEISGDSYSFMWVTEIENVTRKLISAIGVAAMREFKTSHARGKVKPSGCSGWMSKEMFLAMLPLLPVREGFVDLGEYGMQSAVRPVLSAHVQLLCPLCWGTSELNAHDSAVRIQPRRLVGSPDEHDEYTAVSHLWTEFKGDDTVSLMKNDAAIVGGPTSLWIDKLCINQDDSDEKAAELSHMGSYYAGAHTTLICPAHQITRVPLTQQSRHLVAIPSSLNTYDGLKSWKQDPWHDRVWTFQEAYLSRNPQVVNSETNSGLNASWLDFMAYAAEQEEPTRCEVGLPPRHRGLTRVAYGELGDYTTPFLRHWAACSRHNWAPDISSIKMPLGKLLQLTHDRKCTEERDRIIGVLGLAQSAEKFLLERTSSLDDAYREAVRCGALGAEVLLADLGGTSPNSSWIPKNSNVSQHKPSMAKGCNALKPTVDDSGRLVCKASVVNMDIDDGTDVLGWHYHGRVNMRMRNGTSDAHVVLDGRSSTLGRAYMLAPAHETDDLDGKVLVWASDTGDGTHHLEGSAIISHGFRYKNISQQPETEERVELVTLRLG
ncbi:hypothetical protein F4825DRAFT_394955 [Nemania diffusa]|nr:hypothetical protein F4825DRAFT_394955 [Nemania diffusa]